MQTLLRFMLISSLFIYDTIHSVFVCLPHVVNYDIKTFSYYMMTITSRTIKVTITQSVQRLALTKKSIYIGVLVCVQSLAGPKIASDMSTAHSLHQRSRCGHSREHEFLVAHGPKLICAPFGHHCQSTPRRLPSFVISTHSHMHDERKYIFSAYMRHICDA